MLREEPGAVLERLFEIAFEELEMPDVARWHALLDEAFERLTTEERGGYTSRAELSAAHTAALELAERQYDARHLTLGDAGESLVTEQLNDWSVVADPEGE